MPTAASPFEVRDDLPPGLTQVRDYWQGLKRGNAIMPFWDDVNLSSLPDLAGRLMLIDVFESPFRFRFNTIGQEIRALYGSNVTGKFLDEIEVRAPFDYMIAQLHATIESRSPAVYESVSSRSSAQHQGRYARLLLPMWGNGRIEMMLGAIDCGNSKEGPQIFEARD